MRLGIVSDIYGNVRGLDEALRLMGPLDDLLCLGDVVSQTMWSDEVVGRLRHLDAKVVLGNHDLEYLKRLADKAVARGTADRELVDWLGSQPERRPLEVCGKTLVMVHSTPWTYDYVYPGSPEMRRFAEVEADFVLGGHTHTPFVGRIGRALVINPGSAGQRRQVTSAGPLLSYAVFDVATDEVELLDHPDPAASLGLRRDDPTPSRHRRRRA